MMTCHSGGAEGADITFEQECIKHNFEVRAYSFQGHSTKSTKRVILNDEQLDIATPLVITAAKALGRNVPQKDYVANLIKRNFFQVFKSSVVIAVGRLNRQTGHVEGGTGWAVQMAKSYRKGIFVFDQYTESGYMWNVIEKKWDVYDSYPDITGISNFAGIGTRELTAAGHNFIVQFIKRTSDHLANP